MTLRACNHLSRLSQVFSVSIVFNQERFEVLFHDFPAGPPHELPLSIGVLECSPLPLVPISVDVTEVSPQ